MACGALLCLSSSALSALLKSSSTVSSSHESCQRWSPVLAEEAPMVRPTPAPGALDVPAVRCDRSVSVSFQSVTRRKCKQLADEKLVR